MLHESFNLAPTSHRNVKVKPEGVIMIQDRNVWVFPKCWHFSLFVQNLKNQKNEKGKKWEQVEFGWKKQTQNLQRLKP